MPGAGVSMIGTLDHLLVAAFAVAYPVWDLLRNPPIRAAMERGEPGARLRDYRQTIVLLWVFAALPVALWAARSRDFAALGLGPPRGLGFWIAAPLVLGLSAFLLHQPARVARDPDAVSRVRAQLAPVEWYLPHDAAEGRAFAVLSVTAGVCEELLYRGYLMAYLEPGLGIWGAVVVSSALFGFAHVSLGTPAAVRAGVVGAVLAGLYLATGSLWLPMVLHAAIDLGSGRMARMLLADGPAEDGARGPD